MKYLLVAQCFPRCIVLLQFHIYRKCSKNDFVNHLSLRCIVLNTFEELHFVCNIVLKVCVENEFSISNILQMFRFHIYVHLPGQSLSLHCSVVCASPSHGFPPKSSSFTLNLWFSLNPSPHVAEQSPSLQSLHSQWTENWL